jgi:hypothetical protein
MSKAEQYSSSRLSVRFPGRVMGFVGEVCHTVGVPHQSVGLRLGLRELFDMHWVRCCHEL